MRIFAPLYERALALSARPHAPHVLAALSFVEAVIFPVPPEVMIAPMTLAKPRRGLHYAALSLAFSLLGGALGYLLGRYAFDFVSPLLAKIGWLPKIESVVASMRDELADPWRVFILLVLAGFTPVPLKVVTWASGIIGVAFVPFLAGLAVGRGKRVFLLAGALMLGGERAEQAIHRWIEPIGWAVLALLVVAFVVWKLWF